MKSSIYNHVEEFTRHLLWAIKNARSKQDAATNNCKLPNSKDNSFLQNGTFFILRACTANA